jgi:hypothetical protein
MPDKGLTHIGDVIRAVVPELTPDDGVTVSVRTLKGAEMVTAVRTERDAGKQKLAYNSRPFVLCGLPLRRPPKNVLLHVRRNGQFFLQVAGHPMWGLPFGQDRLIPIWLATIAKQQDSRVIRFRSGAEILEQFGLPNSGKVYRRLAEGFRRIFASTMFFGTETALKKEAVWDWTRFHYIDRLQLWFTKETNQQTLEGDDFVNQVQLSEAFWKELKAHPIPIEKSVIREFAQAPGLLDLYMWLSWRCYTAKGEVVIPLFGKYGLVSQLGMAEQSPKRFRQTLRAWLERIRVFWPECPAYVSDEGDCFIVNHAKAVRSKD